MAEYIVNSETEPALFYGDKYDELIRCKDCVFYRYSYTHDEHYCDLFDLDYDTVYKPRENDYCSQAERKKDNG